MFRGSAARPRSVMLRGECCGHLDAWPVGGGLAGGGLAHRLGCAAPRPALALCVAERAVVPLELGDLVHGRRARGRRSRDEAAAPGGSVTDHHRRAGGIQARSHHAAVALPHPVRVVAVGKRAAAVMVGHPFWMPGLVRRFGDRSEYLRRSAACVWDQGGACGAALRPWGGPGRRTPGRISRHADPESSRGTRTGAAHSRLSSAQDYPARVRRVNGAPCGRVACDRLSPAIDPTSTRQGVSTCEENGQG